MRFTAGGDSCIKKIKVIKLNFNTYVSMAHSYDGNPLKASDSIDPDYMESVRRGMVRPVVLCMKMYLQKDVSAGWRRWASSFRTGPERYQNSSLR
jgi:hypothetical protein